MAITNRGRRRVNKRGRKTLNICCGFLYPCWCKILKNKAFHWTANELLATCEVVNMTCRTGRRLLLSSKEKREIENHSACHSALVFNKQKNQKMLEGRNVVPTFNDIHQIQLDEQLSLITCFYVEDQQAIKKEMELLTLRNSCDMEHLSSYVGKELDKQSKALDNVFQVMHHTQPYPQEVIRKIFKMCHLTRGQCQLCAIFALLTIVLGLIFFLSF
ncbi:syntaxin-10 isoform X2 [Ornithorhynchus anatinus]|uniref:syntaxin-10 isoform X2 n=1 Tax=Ornithorhynchus anatinus TaxID=9258 RepID=UPI000454A992|nr:syntaxin-10 isoform X2 [Ornithorhynchus anatinus]